MRKRFKLKDDHPFMERVRAAFEAMEDEGVRVYNHGSVLTVVDLLSKEEYELRDLEDNLGGNSPSPDSIPPFFDYKLTYEKEVPDE